MKLVAGLTGASLDALVQRDAQARLRRVTAITVAALIAMLAMALLLVAALRARSEADRQRAKAEGLVEYMLTDLREKLKGVGRLDVMTAVNERAMAYYGNQQSLEGLPPESLDRRARILHAMGEDDEKRGRLDKALVKFKEAHRTTAAVLAKKPNDPDAIFAHAQSEYWVGEVLLRRNLFDQVAPYFRAYLKQADHLVALDPDNSAWQQERGYATGNLCTLGLAPTLPQPDALARCQSALQQMRSILARKPSDASVRENVANRLAWVADAWKARGNLAQAQAARLEQEAIISALLEAASDDKNLRELWLKTEIMTAEIFALRGDPENARRRLGEASAAYRELISFDPANHQWQSWGKKISRVSEIVERSHQNDGSNPN
jgi:tetratricopeptide (TPR) repeat protein